MRYGRIVLCVAAILAGVPALAGAQYFGRNKVQYLGFQFRLLATEHFDIYYYAEEAEAADIASRLAERWYSRLTRFFDHQLRGRQPLILYASAAHFRQTNALDGLIGEGTGGFTEAMKRRIVLPMSGSLADTDHVLGHELVHAFQFDITGTDPREKNGDVPEIALFPLWFVEGMAEYVSIGPVDAQTAMWMRDSALREKLPHVKDLDNPKYFPYRWGHSFWAFVGAKYGDRVVASLVRSAANPRNDLAGLCRQLGTTPDALTADWHHAIHLAAQAAQVNSSLQSEPKRIVSHDAGGGRYNVGPRVSPDGKQVAFFSERDRFAIELYLADAETGRIEKKLLRSSADPHFDSLEFLNSAGAWMPDGKTLGVTAVRNGKPVLALIDIKSANIRREIELPGLDDAINPSFSPDGKSAVVSGNKGGLIDLYVLSLVDGSLDRLTHDPFADLEATYTPDGKSVIFVTERFSTDLVTLEPGPLRLARVDLETGVVSQIAGFLRGKHLSPQVSPDGVMLTFIADPDGVSNLYRMPIEGGPVMRLSSFATGVAGITSSSPALSMSAASDRLVFSVFEDDGHSVYTLDEKNTVSLVAPEATGMAALLPGRSVPAGDVQRLLSDTKRGLPAAGHAGTGVAYKQRMTLDILGQPTLSAGVSQFGGYVSGSISASFSDMLGDHSLDVAAQVSNRIADLGAAALYVNRKHRWNWAVQGGQSPYALWIPAIFRNPSTGDTILSETIQRQTSRGGTFAAIYPFTAARRIEFSVGAQHLSFTQDVRTRTYAPNGTLIDQASTQTTLAASMRLVSPSVALVYDSSIYGATSPITGRRYRAEVSQSGGSLNYTSGLIDFRQYFMPKRPVTLALRVLHYGRYGVNAEHGQLVPMFAGHAEFVHGYGVGSFLAGECRNGAIDCSAFNNLVGSRLLVTNFEVRAPLVGLFTGELNYGKLPVEVAAFMDAGVAWTKDDLPTFAGGSRRMVRSVGGAVRVNAFGILIIELSASKPLDRAIGGIRWQLGLRQGF